MMTSERKLVRKILAGASDSNIRFDELRSLLKRLGFNERVRGDHHIFTRDGVAEILNLQPRRGRAKDYQVKQTRTVLLKYGLVGEEHDE
jgi:hypothetical protein